MDFAFTDEQAMINETARAFFTSEASSARVRAAMARDGFDQDLWKALCEDLGLVGASVPVEEGGAGLGMVEAAIVAEAAGASLAPIPLLGANMALAAISAGGSRAQKDRWLAPIIAGRTIAVFAQADDLREQGGRLMGAAPLVPHGALADLVIVSGPEGVWLVDAGASGVAVKSFTTMDQTRPLATIRFEGANAERLDDSDAARAAALSAGWLCLAAEALGGGQEALDRTVAYAKQRIQFGRPIGSFQAYKHRLADRMVDIEQARSAVYWAACAIDEESDERFIALPAAKAFCADAFFQCAADMIQLHGGIGFTWEHDAHLFFKRARSIQTLLGKSDWHREQIARQMLGEAA